MKRTKEYHKSKNLELIAKSFKSILDLKRELFVYKNQKTDEYLITYEQRISEYFMLLAKREVSKEPEFFNHRFKKLLQNDQQEPVIIETLSQPKERTVEDDNDEDELVTADDARDIISALISLFGSREKLMHFIIYES